MTVDGINYGPIEAMLDREQASNVWITFGIREGKNREVRNVLRHLGLQVARLIRVSFGPFQLGEIAEGEVAEVPTRVLRDQLGEKLAKAGGRRFFRAGRGAQAEAARPAPASRPRARRSQRDGADPGRSQNAKAKGSRAAPGKSKFRPPDARRRRRDTFDARDKPPPGGARDPPPQAGEGQAQAR